MLEHDRYLLEIIDQVDKHQLSEAIRGAHDWLKNQDVTGKEVYKSIQSNIMDYCGGILAKYKHKREDL